MMIKKLFIYDWISYDKEQKEVDENGKEVTTTSVYIVGYGINEQNITECIKVHSYKPYIYIKIAENNFHEEYLPKIKNVIQGFYGGKIKIEFVKMKQLYYYDKEFKDGKYIDKLHPYFKISFISLKQKGQFIAFIKKTKSLRIGDYIFYISNSIIDNDRYSVYHQFCVKKNLSLSGWIQFNNYTIENNDVDSKSSKSVINSYLVDVDYVERCDDIKYIPKCKILSFDIECYSHRKGFMPSVICPEDKIFQISVVLYENDKIEKEILFCLGNCGQTKTKSIKVENCKSEERLLAKFSQLVQLFRPNIIIGFNILGFDIPYIIGRCVNHNHCERFLNRFTLSTDRICEKTTRRQDEESALQYTDGILVLDFYHIARKMYSGLPNHKLETVANFLIGSGKDPLNHEDIFEGYIKGTPESLAIVGEYCVKDARVTLLSALKSKVWLSICEQAKITHTHVSDIYGKGQQIRVFNQVKNHCYKNNILVDPPDKTQTNTKYKGAIILKPTVGLFNNVATFDFASLYPSVTIAHNLDYTTITRDGDKGISYNEKNLQIYKWVEHTDCKDCDDFSDKKIDETCQGKEVKFVDINEAGVIPTILINLIAARKETREIIKQNEIKINQLRLEEDKEIINQLKDENNLLDIRQLEYKLAGNSAYGAMGASVGYLPLLEAAMCVTYLGRTWIMRIKKMLEEIYLTEVLYGDTDSCFVLLEKVDFKDIYSLCKKISSEMEQKLPKPMKLEFDKIYKRLLIITKKKYIAYPCDKDGNYEYLVNTRLSTKEKPEKTIKMVVKGAMLIRKEYCEFAKIIYEKVVRKILDSDITTNQVIKTDLKERLFDEIANLIKDQFHKVLNGDYPDDLFTITKSLSQNIDQYKSKLPHVIIAKLMNQRLAGSAAQFARVTYIITNKGGLKAKQAFKVEEYDYFCKYRNLFKIDYLYLIQHQLVKPLDQILKIVFNKEKFCENTVKIIIDQQKVKEEVIINLIGDEIKQSKIVKIKIKEKVIVPKIKIKVNVKVKTKKKESKKDKVMTQSYLDELEEFKRQEKLLMEEIDKNI